MILGILSLMALALLFFADRASACTTVIVGKKASPTGRVIVGHNEDDGGRVIVRHGFVPAGLHAAGETLPAEEGCAAIPQARKTHGFYWSEMKAAAGGLTTADSMLNDQGVLIVSDSCADSKEDTADPSRLGEGGVGFNLRRIMAERASTAREAVEIAASLLDRCGYVSSGRAYTAADANEAWLLQVVSGRHYAARRVADDEAAFIPNCYTIHDVDPQDRENFILSPDLIDYAVQKGWYDPASGPFDFARAYQAESSWISPANAYRSAAGCSLLTRRNVDAGQPCPFAVKPPLPVGLEQVMEILRCHYEGTALDPQWARARFPGGTPHDKGIRRICTETTLESTVTLFGERPETTVCWTSFGRPCELPYVPLHPLCGALPGEIAAMENAAAELERHLTPDAALSSWNDGGWQKFRDFQNLFEMVYQEHEAEHSRWLWSFEEALIRSEAHLQAQTAPLYAAGRAQEAAAALADADAAALAQCLEALQCRRCSLREAKVAVQPSSFPMGSGETLTVSFELEEGRTPRESSLMLLLGGGCARADAIRVQTGSLSAEGRRWRFRVSAAELQKAGVPGIFDFWLGGRDTQGRSFGGGALVTIG